MNELGGHVERHRRELLIHCYRMLGSFPDAEDAVQETLLRAWRYRDSVKEGAPLRPWLYRVATNVCLDASMIREDATFRMPPDPEIAVGRDAIFKLWIDGGFGSEGFGRLRCVETRANLQPAVAAYVCLPGDSDWRALALEVLRIEEGSITEIVVFTPDHFPLFGLPMVLDPALARVENA